MTHFFFRVTQSRGVGAKVIQYSKNKKVTWKCKPISVSDMEYYTGRHYAPVSPSQFTMSAKSKLAICDFSKIKIWLLGTKMVYFIPTYPTVTGFKTDTLAKLFGLQNRTPVFDKITIFSKARHHQNPFVIKKYSVQIRLTVFIQLTALCAY